MVALLDEADGHELDFDIAELNTPDHTPPSALTDWLGSIWHSSANAAATSDSEEVLTGNISLNIGSNLSKTINH